MLPGTVESTYGSDKAGMVCGYVFAASSAARSVDSEEAAAILASTAAGDEFLWLHFSLANAASLRWLREHTRLPDAFFDLRNEITSTRVEVVDDVLVGVLNDVQFFASEASSIVTLYVDRRLLISARTTALRAIDRLRMSVKQGERFRSPAELLAHLLRDQADVLTGIVREATTQVDEMEDRIISRKAASRGKLGSVRRTLVRLQRLLAPEPAALFRLLNRPPSWLAEPDLADLRQSAEELSTAVADSAALGERIRLLQEELVALLNEQTNRTLFVLTFVTVLALPLTIIPGLFGMNVGGIPFAESGAGFWIILVLLVAFVGSCAALVWTRWVRR